MVERRLPLICEDRWVVGSEIVSGLGEVEVEGGLCNGDQIAAHNSGR